MYIGHEDGLLEISVYHALLGIFLVWISNRQFEVYILYIMFRVFMPKSFMPKSCMHKTFMHWHHYFALSLTQNSVSYHYF